MLDYSRDGRNRFDERHDVNEHDVITTTFWLKISVNKYIKAIYTRK